MIVDDPLTDELDFERPSLVVEMSALAGAFQSAPLGRSISIPGKYGSYDITTLLTETFQSKIFLGVSDTGMEVVIKQYLQEKVETNSFGFEREEFFHSHLFSRGGYPNTIEAREFIRYQDRLLSVSPFVRGRNLEEFITRQGSIPAPDVVSLIKPLSRLIHYLHSLGGVHRDIKPSNVMLTWPKSGIVVPLLFDFGISWHPELARYDKPGMLYATPAYMPPEKWDYPTPDLCELTPFVSPKMSAVVKKGMAYDPCERYQTAAEFGNALAEANRK